MKSSALKNTKTYPTHDLHQAGQSPWLDSISRELLRSGKLKSLIEEKSLLGVTSNPSIFEKAICQRGAGYDQDVAKMFRRGASVLEVYDALTISDIQKACDLFKPVFMSSKGEHGFVSLEVMPSLAHATEPTIADARRLFKAVNRPNVMIKVPATREGLPAIRTLIGEGININITLMFSMRHYQDVARVYIQGLQDLKAKGGDLSKVHSVASVFVSRIDSLLDKKLDALAANEPDEQRKQAILELRGKAAIANSKLIYQEFKKIFGGSEFRKLQQAGATIQKVLWGSTSTKNPSYSDLIYVENLVGRETVNTMPQNTLDAVLDHGIIRSNTIEEDLPQAEESERQLKALGFNLNEVGEQLQKDGVRLFIDSFDSLMRTLETQNIKYFKPQAKGKIATIKYSVPSNIAGTAASELAALEKKKFLERFLKGDATLWKEDASHQEVIKNRLGWLRVQDWVIGKLYEIDLLKQELAADGIKDLVLLGMGGSSLAPEVMAHVCDRQPKALRFHVLDTTDPASILAVEKKITLKKSLFLVASKSGSTIETISQFQYFYSQVQKAYGRKAKAEETGKHFIAITDQGSSLQKLATEKLFRKIFVNPTDIGGRYSALSFFGLVPAALIGVDIREIISSAREYFRITEQTSTLSQNPGIALGVYLGVLAKLGRDKVTIWTSPRLATFGAWMEQLVAESTGKEGKGIIPVDGEAVTADPSFYGKDRAFVVMTLQGEKDEKLNGAVRAIKKSGFPVIEIQWPNPACIGGEFLGWEIATPVSSAVLGVNPFDEPNVRESKESTAIFLKQLKDHGKFQVPDALVSVNGAIKWDVLHSLQSGKYVAILAYFERTAAFKKAIDPIRARLSRKYGVPALLGFGPRYLHSIGQLYKGGPKTGVFIQFLAQDKKDFKVPGETYTFGQLKKAQALGDLQALLNKGLPLLAVDLGRDIPAGIDKFLKKCAAGL